MSALTTAAPASGPIRTPRNRVIQGLLLTSGGGLLEYLAGAHRISFLWTPLVIGLTYLLAALVDGRRGGYWATAVGFCGWGAMVAYLGQAQPERINTAGAYMAAVGVTVLAAIFLRARGVAVSDAGLALTIAGSGVVLAFAGRYQTLDDATTYAIGLAMVGLLNVVGGAWQLLRAG